MFTSTRAEWPQTFPFLIGQLIPRRFLDTSLIEVDAQPNYVRVTVKGKIFQMAFNDEVRVDAATSKRSQTTGHLLIVIPKLNATNCVTIKEGTEKAKFSGDETKMLKESVNIRNIVVDDSEVPPLIWIFSEIFSASEKC